MSQEQVALTLAVWVAVWALAGRGEGAAQAQRIDWSPVLQVAVATAQLEADSGYLNVAGMLVPTAPAAD